MDACVCNFCILHVQYSLECHVIQSSFHSKMAETIKKESSGKSSS